MVKEINEDNFYIYTFHICILHNLYIKRNLHKIIKKMHPSEKMHPSYGRKRNKAKILFINNPTVVNYLYKVTV